MLDTSLIVAAERGKFDLASFLATRLREGAVLSAITASELLVGVHRASEKYLKQRTEYVEGLLSTLKVIPFDLEVARVHANLVAIVAIAGTPIGSHDLMIAATALSRGDALVTRDARSFPRVPGLKFELIE